VPLFDAVRLALAQIWAQKLKSGFTLLGVTIGIVGALALGQVMSSLVYGVKPTDPLTFLAVAMVLAVVALSATIIPAYRAARVDPMVALRYE